MALTSVSVQLIHPIPNHLCPSIYETHLCSEMKLAENVTVSEFCTQFESMVAGMGRLQQGIIIVHTQSLGMKHCVPRNLGLVREMYFRIFDQLRDKVHSSIIVIQNPIFHTALSFILRMQKESATEVHVVASPEEAQVRAKEIEARVQLPLLRKAAASPVAVKAKAGQTSAPQAAFGTQDRQLFLSCIAATALVLYFFARR